MATALKPRAEAKKHPTSFYAGLVLCGVDGSQFSVANTPQVKQTVSGLWQFLELTEGMLTSRQVSKVVTKALHQIAKYALGKRRKRSCPRALRQPVSSWPRLVKNTYKNGEAEYELLPLKTPLP